MRIQSVYLPTNILLVHIITLVAATLHLQNLTYFNSPPDYLNGYLLMIIWQTLLSVNYNVQQYKWSWL